MRILHRDGCIKIYLMHVIAHIRSRQSLIIIMLSFRANKMSVSLYKTDVASSAAALICQVSQR